MTVASVLWEEIKRAGRFLKDDFNNVPDALQRYANGK